MPKGRKHTMKQRRFIEKFNTISIGICIAATIVLIVAAVYVMRSVNDARSYSVSFNAIQQTEGDGTQQLLLRGLSLRKGIYKIGIGYVADNEAQIEISLDNDTYLTDELPATPEGSGTKSYDFEIKTGTDRGRIDFTYPEGSDLKLAYITISSGKPLYYDGLIWGAVLILLIPIVWILMYFWLGSTHKISMLVAIGIFLVQIIPFVINTGLHMGIDTRAHMMRIEGIYYGLLDGQFPAVICPEWNNSYGQTGALYPNLFLYIPAVFRLLGMSQLGAFKLFIFIAVAASSMIAYSCAKSVYDHDWQIALAVLMICLDNMHLYNMLGDGRFGGAFLAELFYPFIVAGLINMFYRDKDKWYFLAYGVAGVICCHIMSATIVCFAVVIFTLFSIKRLKDGTIYRSIVKAVLLSAGLVLGTAVCFFKFYFSDWGQEKLQWENFVSTLFPRGYLPDDIRYTYIFVLILICLICFGILKFKHVSERVNGTYIIPSFLCSIVLTWMATVAFPWGLLTRIGSVEYYANMLQDAYRFLSLSTCFMAFCVPKLLEGISDTSDVVKMYKRKAIVLPCMAITLVCAAFYLCANYEFFYRNDYPLYYDPVIGEVEYQLEDYLPAGTMSEWYVSDAGYISDEEAVSSLSYERSGTHVNYSYTNSKDGSYVEFPKFYYDGYVAENEKGDSVDVVKGDRNRARVYLKVTDTPAEIRMWYKVPWYMTASSLISFGIWILSIMIIELRSFHRHL